jgi:hypothetical protein
MSNPSYTLDVGGDINIASGSNLRIGGSIPVFSRWTASGSDIYRSSGNVGIGTVSPTSKLELAANGGSSIITLKRTNTSNGGAKGGIRFTENTNGYNVGTIACLGDGANTSGALCFYTKASSTHTGIYLPTTDERMRITSTGNVGIGTTSPSHPLTIQETTTNTNTVTYPLAIRAISSGTVANGFGAGIRFQCERRDTDDYQSLAGSVEVYGAGNLPGTSDLWNMRFGVRNNDTAVTPMTLRYDGNVGIGTTSPIAALDINRGAENNTTPALSIRGGLYDPSDLYVLNTYNVNTGVGFAAKVIGVNIKNKVESNNTVQLRNNVGGLTSAGAIYLGSDDINQGIFGVLGADGTAGTTLSEHLTVRAGGNVGIGLTGPESKLHIYGSDNPLMLQSQRSPYPKLSYDFSGTNAENFQFYDHHGSGRGFLYGRKYTTGTNPNANAGWHFYGNDNTLALRIDGSANVGIGTASPDTTLDVAGSINNGTYAINNGYMANRSLSIGDHALNYGGGNGWNSNTAGLMMECLNNTEIAIHDSGTRVASFMYFEGGSTNRFTIGRNMGWGGISTLALNGNVGIGTTSPDTELDVNGGIRTRLPHLWARQTVQPSGTTSLLLTWNSTVYNDTTVGNMYSTTRTCNFPIKGVYVVTVQAHSYIGGGGSYYTDFKWVQKQSNGSTRWTTYNNPRNLSQNSGNSDMHTTGTMTIVANAGDYLEVTHSTSVTTERNYNGGWNNIRAACIYAIN